MKSYRKYLIFLLLVVGSCLFLEACNSKLEINTDLKGELAQILEKDQKYRSYLSRVNRDSVFRDSLITAWDVPEDSLMQAIWDKQRENDRLNLARVVEIFNKYGYPGKTMVGDNENEAAWYVLQHAPVESILKYFPLIKKASESNELPKHLAVMMEDRMLMFHGKEQVYGTQGQRITLESGEYLWIIWPVIEPENVNERRKEQGFGSTIEENAEQMGIEYQPYSMDELKKLTPNLPHQNSDSDKGGY